MGRDALIAWAAGYLDGEGAFIVGPRNSGRAEISVHSVDPRSVNRLHQLFGGRLTFESRRQEDYKDTHRWRVHGEEARAAAAALLESELLTVKYEQAIAVRDMGKYPKGSRMRDWLWDLHDTHKRQNYARYRSTRR